MVFFFLYPFPVSFFFILRKRTQCLTLSEPVKYDTTEKSLNYLLRKPASHYDVSQVFIETTAK